MTCLKGDVEKAMEVFGDVVNNPSFPDDETKQMKQRIVAQIEGQDADWFQQANRFFKKVYYGPKNSPYQFLPTGTKETVAKFTADEARKWYREHVLTGRRVIAIYGDIDADKAKSLSREYLGVGDPIKKSSTSKPSFDRKDEPAPKPSVDVQRVELNKTEQPLAGIVIGYNAEPVLGDPTNYAMDVADTMCSGYRYPTGYLHEILRGRGLVYMVHAQNWPGRSPKLPGTFLVYAGCDPSKVNEVIDIILENIARLQGSEKDTQPGWFARSKELITTSDALEHETPAQQAETAALDELMGLGYNFHEKFQPKIEAVKLDEVRNLCASRLTQCVITVSTPDPDSVKIKTGKRTYDSFPPVDLTPRGVQHDAK
jgi:zinc protease